jgi:predicted outer membrane repeat protein
MKTQALSIRFLCGLLVLGACACGDDSGGPADGDADADGTDEGHPGCEGCWIDGTCRDAGAVSPSNPCLVCDPARSASAWSDDDGTACDDGNYCNGADTCLGGVCAGHAGDPCTDDGVFCNGAETCNEVIDSCLHDENACPDDGMFCNGAETCDETADSCGHAGDPCTDGTCFEAENRCCTPDASIGCNSAGDVASFDSCGHAGAVVEVCSHAPDALCREGVCGCFPGWSGPDCDACVRYVDGATGDDAALGTSWSTAKATVQAGIDEVAPGCEVWVKAGTYTASATGDTNASFVLAPGVALVGGFDGSEIALSERDLAANRTILSGDIGVVGDETDNTRHIVIGAEGATLDGLVIADGTYYCGECGGGGAGLYCDGVAMTVRNCLFEDNQAAGGMTDGAAIFVGDAPITVEDCVFRNNSAEAGGAIYVGRNDGHAGDTVVRRCVFESNTVWWAGGGMLYEHSSSPAGARLEIESCVFTGNSASGTGGALAVELNSVDTPSIAIRNSVFLRNHADTEGGGLNVAAWGVTAGAYEVVNSIFWGNTAPTFPQLNNVATVTYADVEGAGYDGTNGNISLDPRFVQGDPAAGPLDLHLQAGSPCIDAGNDTVAPARDIEGHPRYDDPLTPNCATAGAPECDWFSDIGAYEYQD